MRFTLWLAVLAGAAAAFMCLRLSYVLLCCHERTG